MALPETGIVVETSYSTSIGCLDTLMPVAVIPTMDANETAESSASAAGHCRSVTLDVSCAGSNNLCQTLGNSSAWPNRASAT